MYGRSSLPREKRLNIFNFFSCFLKTVLYLNLVERVNTLPYLYRKQGICEFGILRLIPSFSVGIAFSTELEPSSTLFPIFTFSSHITLIKLPKLAAPISCADDEKLFDEAVWSCNPLHRASASSRFSVALQNTNDFYIFSPAEVNYLSSSVN